jgi:hypothetical protein
MEAIEVTARFDEYGTIHPQRLRWLGREYPVEAAGRRWQAQDGLHILVLTPTGRAFEICFNATEGRWYMVQTPSDRMLA